MPKKMHQLKIDYDWGIVKAEGKKPFEVRMNDRNYQVGDLVCYEVINKNKAQSQEDLKKIEELEKEVFVIEYVLNNDICRFGIRPGYVVFSEKQYKNEFEHIGDMVEDISQIIVENSKKIPVETARVIATELLVKGYRYNKNDDQRNVDKS